MVFYVYIPSNETSSTVSSINETNIQGSTWSLEKIRTENNDCGRIQTGAVRSQFSARFDFNIPTNAIILGIKVRIHCYSTDSSNNIEQNLWIRSGVSGSWSSQVSGHMSYTATSPSCTKCAWVEFGSVTDLWGKNWTVSDFNDVTRDNLKFEYYRAGIEYQGYIDHITMTVYYIADFYPPSKVFFTRPLGEVGYGYMIIPSKDVDFSTYHDTQEQEITIVDINGKKLFHGMITTPHVETDGVRIDFKEITQQLVDRKCKRNYVLEKGTVSEVSD